MNWSNVLSSLLTASITIYFLMLNRRFLTLILKNLFWHREFWHFTVKPVEIVPVPDQDFWFSRSSSLSATSTNSSRRWDNCCKGIVSHCRNIWRCSWSLYIWSTCRQRFPAWMLEWKFSLSPPHWHLLEDQSRCHHWILWDIRRFSCILCWQFHFLLWQWNSKEGSHSNYDCIWHKIENKIPFLPPSCKSPLFLPSLERGALFKDCTFSWRSNNVLTHVLNFGHVSDECKKIKRPGKCEVVHCCNLIENEPTIRLDFRKWVLCWTTRWIQQWNCWFHIFVYRWIVALK